MTQRLRKAAGRKRRTVKAVSWYQKKHSVGDLASKAYYGVRMLKGIINSEKKHFRYINSGQNVDYNGMIASLCAISQGDDVANRSGNSVMAKSLYYNFDIVSNVSQTGTIVRVMFIQDTMSLGTVPTAADVLAVTGAPHAPSSVLNMVSAVSRRFKILYEKKFHFSGASNCCKGDTGVLQLGNTHIKYTSTSGTDEGKNQIYLLMISNVVTTLLPSVAIQTSLSYYDN